MSTDNFVCTEHVVPGQHIRHYARGTSDTKDHTLHLAVKQYTPRYASPPQPGAVTIIAAHGIALPKECYEPLFDELYRFSQSTQDFKIRNIWIADVANQGASGILNENHLGSEPSPFDDARDLLCIINHFRDEIPRPLVGLGHSMGGNVIISLALLHPRLLTTVIAVEPAILKSHLELRTHTLYPITFKPDLWSSQSTAMEAIRRKPIYKSWHPTALDRYLRFSLRDTPTLIHPDPGQVTFTTSKHQEVLSYARAAYPPRGTPLSSFQPTHTSHPDFEDGPGQNRQNAFYQPAMTHIYNQLPLLAPSCLFVYGAQSPMATAGARSRKDKLSTTGTGVGGSGGHAIGRVQEYVIEEATHFSPQEKPEELARVSASWLEKELKRWREEEDNEERRLAGVGPRERTMVEEDWKWWLRELFGSGKAKNGSISKVKL